MYSEYKLSTANKLSLCGSKKGICDLLMRYRLGLILKSLTLHRLCDLSSVAHGLCADDVNLLSRKKKTSYNAQVCIYKMIRLKKLEGLLKSQQPMYMCVSKLVYLLVTCVHCTYA